MSKEITRPDEMDADVLGRRETRSSSPTRCPRGRLHLGDGRHPGTWTGLPADAPEVRRQREKALVDISQAKVARSGLENMGSLQRKEGQGPGPPAVATGLA